MRISQLARNYIGEAIEVIDGMEIPHPLPLHVILSDEGLRSEIIEIGIARYKGGFGAKAFQVMVPKGNLSFRTFTKLSPASMIAWEFFARKIALSTFKENTSVCSSYKFSKVLPKRLYPERSKTDRDRWENFVKQKHSGYSAKRQDGAQNLALTADIARFFDYVNHEKLYAEILKSTSISRAMSKKIISFLGDVMQSNIGLPVGPQSSFVYGDVLLLSVDKEAKKRVAKCLRWADEYWWYDLEKSRLEEKYREALILLNELGLAFNDGKSQFVPGDQVVEDMDQFSQVRKEYYRVRKASPTQAAGFLCGVMTERFRAGNADKIVDKFLLNRLKETFLDPSIGTPIQPIAERVFEHAFLASREAIHQWHGILKILPDQKRSALVAKAVLSNGRHLMDSDKARLLELSCSLKPGAQQPISTRELRGILENQRRCSSLRGNALRSQFCQSNDVQKTIDMIEYLTTNSDCSELKLYCASTAILFSKSDFDRAMIIIEESNEDQELSILLRGFRLLKQMPSLQPWLPTHRSLVLRELATYRKTPY